MPYAIDSIRRLALVGFGGLAVGCSLQIHEPSVAHSDDSRTVDWFIHCETAKYYEQYTENVPAAENAQWMFAQDVNGDRYTLQGEMVDGFFEVSGLRDAAGHDLPVSRTITRQLCIDTLARRDPGEGRMLGWVMAATSREMVNVPPVYPDEMAHDGSVTRVVIFGDSLTDTGRLKQRLKIFPAKPYWIGRFSNGPVWPEYLAMATGLGVQNHSYGGASVIEHDTLPGSRLIGRVREAGQFFVSGSIELQIDDYLDRTLVDGKIERPRSTAYLIWAGANDYISKEPVSGLITTFLNSPEGESGYRRVVESTVSKLLGHVETLYDAGARRFVLLNLPDLGRTPIVLQNTTYTPDFTVTNDSARRLELARRLTTLTRYHNTLLDQGVSEMRNRLPQAEFVLVDSFHYFNLLDGDARVGRARPEDLGYNLADLTVVLEYDGQRLALQQRCYRGGYIGPYNPDNVCAHPEAAVFWDTVHPTTLTHCWQAWTVAKAMASVGWTNPPPDPPQYRAWCEQVVNEVVNGSLGRIGQNS